MMAFHWLSSVALLLLWVYCTAVDEDSKTCGQPLSIPYGRPVNVSKLRYKHNETVEYECTRKIARCLHGEWKLPSCTDAGGRCDRPPSIDNGDILEMPKSEYMPGEKVHYKCQSLYRMEGIAEVVCYNGHWTQPPTCIVPCTTSEEDMRRNNIRLKWRADSKVYSESGDRVEFVCRWGYLPDPSSSPFIVRCVDGRLEYPRCIGRE